MSWYRAEFGSGEQVPLFHEICRAFQQAFIACGGPRTLALFTYVEGGRRRRMLYFSPDSTRHAPGVLRTCGAVPCPPPAATGLTLIYGAPGAETLLRGDLL